MICFCSICASTMYLLHMRHYYIYILFLNGLVNNKIMLSVVLLALYLRFTNCVFCIEHVPSNIY